MVFRKNGHPLPLEKGVSKCGKTRLSCYQDIISGLSLFADTS